MIPKIIHYCWFGGNSLPELFKEYIAGWKNKCPDYQIIEWNENNFDISLNYYINEAYVAKKWAFITDYVRLFVLYKYGGIYMDTDVEVLKNLDCYLFHSAFSGFESNFSIPTGIMGSEKNNYWIGKLLDYYTDRHFLKEDNTYDMTTNVIIITAITRSLYPYLNLNNTYQETKDGVVFYPSDYFCPKDWRTGLIHLSENTHVIHHFSGSWIASGQKYNLEKEDLLKKYKFLKQIVESQYFSQSLAPYFLTILVILRVDGVAGLYRQSLKKLNTLMKKYISLIKEKTS